MTVWKNNLKQPNLQFIKTILMKDGTLRLAEMPVFTVINVFKENLIFSDMHNSPSVDSPDCDLSKGGGPCGVE